MSAYEPPALMPATACPGVARHVLVRLLRPRGVPDGGRRRLRAEVWVPGQGTRTLHWSQPLRAPTLAPGRLARAAIVEADLAAAAPVEALRVWPAALAADVDLLQTVPDAWLGPQAAHTRAAFALLWQRLSEPMRAWFNALFWRHPQRLWAFVQARASLQHHHAGAHGLLQHSLDCAQRALRLAAGDPSVDAEVLIMAALLHDLGKADEYRWDAAQRRWRLTLRGELIGHRLSTLQWMTEALAELPLASRPQALREMAVHHAIHACWAPDWVGLRRPRTPEALVLGSVDALSGQIDLIEQCRARGAPAGRYVPALGTRVYWGLGASATAT